MTDGSSSKVRWRNIVDGYEQREIRRRNRYKCQINWTNSFGCWIFGWRIEKWTGYLPISQNASEKYTWSELKEISIKAPNSFNSSALCSYLFW